MELHAEEIKARLKASVEAAGAIAFGVAKAGETDPALDGQFARWLDSGGHASMQWLERHRTLRTDPANVLPGVKSVVSIAFPYFRRERRPASLPRISMYAYGADYHDVIRKKLKPLRREFEALTGARTRVCVDSAPIPERYWALKAGIGRRGDNGTVIIDGYGSFFFLCELLTDLPLPPDEPSTLECSHCGRCRKSCPGNAIRPDGTLACRRCLSFLTIERNPDEPLPDESRIALESEEGRATLFGCDICQLVCPHNAAILRSEAGTTPAPVTETLERVLCLNPASMTDDDWETTTRGTALRRALKLLKTNRP